MSFGISIDPLSWISGNEDRRLAEQQAAEQRNLNALDRQFEKEKFFWSQHSQRKQWQREDNRFQRLVADANKAGISVTTALGAGGSTPVSVGIPGHTGKRIAGNRIGRNGTGAIRAEMEFANQVTRKHAHDSALEQQFQADLAYWRSKQAETDYWKSQKDAPLPKKYTLYDDNTEEARKHISSGGYVIPTGASMELPESIGAYQYGVPYWKEENFMNFDPSRSRYPNRWDVNIVNP